MTMDNVKVKKQANIYHQGNVTSRSIITATGEMKSLGIMLPGIYHFSTEAAESMEILQGQCRVKPQHKADWQDYGTGDTFEIPANSHFEIEVIELLDYLCHFDSTL